MNTRVRYLLVCLGVLPITACARCAPNKVAHGVSRLTVRNVGAVATLALRDGRCGFESEAVKATPSIEGEIGKLGTVTYSVSNCEIQFAEDNPYVSQDCNGTQTIVRGTVLVNATQVIQGIITGEAETPVIPSGPDAATLNLQAHLTDFSAESSASANVLTIYGGSLEAIMRPRLAVDDDRGACSVATSNVRFESVRYSPSRGHVKTETRSFDVDIDESDLYAVNGQYADFENELWGDMTVWGQHEPIDGGPDGLDPDYEREAFHASYSCAEGLAQPVQYECSGFLAPILAQNAARLSVRMLGRIADMLEKNTNCGFSSPEVQARAEISGEIGGLGAATQRVQSCEINLPTMQVVRSDCVGTETLAQGRIIVSGTKRIEGRLTGNPVTPAVPMSDAPATIQIQVQAFDDFLVMEAGTGMRIRTGQMSGTFVPRTAQDSSLSNACAFVTSVSRIQDISFDVDTDAQVISEGTGTFDVKLGDTRLQALSGNWNGEENLLDGYIEVDGERWDLPADPADDGLEPDYNRERYERTWICDSIAQPVSHECDFTAPLAQGASQLSIQMAGSLVSLLDADERCGFSSPGVNLVLDGETGRRGGRATYSVNQPCRMDFGEKTEISRDCSGKATYASGVVEITGTKVIDGLLTGDPETPVVPTSKTPATIDFSARVENFAVWTDPESQKLMGRSGRLSGRLAPETGIDVTTGACSLTTPVAQITDVAWQGANVRLEKDGLQFDLRIERSDLDAQNGDGDAQTNHLTGTLLMDGTSWDIPVDGNPALDPEYDQSAFDASYACTDGLRPVDTDQQCDLYQMLGENVARLVALTSGGIAGEVNGDDECGFEDFWVKTNPDRVEGDTGDPGLLEWNIDNCSISRSGSAMYSPVSTDCNGREQFWRGGLRVDARRTVTGTRRDEYWIFDSIEPDDPTSVEIELVRVGLTNYRLWEDDPGVPSPLRGITIDGGTLSGVVAPVTGERADDRGVFDVSTPVAHMTGLALRGAPVQVHSGQMTFKLFVDETDVEAFNGSYRGLGMQNMLRGHVVIDGVRVDFDTALVEDYSQADFDQAYVCTDNLRAPITPM